MKIYTKTGDDGSTGLLGGTRVSKSDPRIECYGTVDELNASLGLVAVAADAPLRTRLERVQAELFSLGAHLALPEDERATAMAPPLDPQLVERLEAEIDAATAELPPLRNFILPGGSEAAARVHIARTICRRAERLAVSLGETIPVRHVAVKYLNRLSDWLFVEARYVNHRLGVADVIWTG
jgi:cob(I)alamin adenosyltransferase